MSVTGGAGYQAPSRIAAFADNGKATLFCYRPPVTHTGRPWCSPSSPPLSNQQPVKTGCSTRGLPVAMLRPKAKAKAVAVPEANAAFRGRCLLFGGGAAFPPSLNPFAPSPLHVYMLLGNRC